MANNHILELKLKHIFEIHVLYLYQPRVKGPTECQLQNTRVGIYNNFQGRVTTIK